ncbi:MAG: hypothetical protein EBZ48_06910 [Proteobacteria bacterium]|nr:hypothetical protein [Pseudomonadota bacterium]
MPITKFQQKILSLLAPNRSEDSHLAGAAALHFEPNSARYSNDLDFFQDTEERVGAAFSKDSTTLVDQGYAVHPEMSQPGYIRATITKGKEETKIEWAHDSAWRFMPAVQNEKCGYLLHPVDLAVNKVLALAGRDEPRDFLDILFCDQQILPLGALVWAAAGKDPGFTPRSLLELIKRRGKYQQADFERLMLTKKVELAALKTAWLSALERAEEFIRSRPAPEAGCLYYDCKMKRFVAPSAPLAAGIVPHYGRPGGVIPLPDGQRLE